MKKIIVLAMFLMTGCGLLPTPDEFPPHPVTVIVEIPQVTATATLEPRMRPILPDGIQVGNGELWFNYFCMDLSCSEAQFRITQINR